MAKEISGYVKLQVKGGQANPAPPVGPALGSKGVNIMEFCKPTNLTVYGRYTRRGGIDINPIRSTLPDVVIPQIRLIRQ